MLQPGEPIPAESAPTQISRGPTPAPSPTAVTAADDTSSPNKPPVMSEKHTLSLSTGAIIGIAVGGFAVLALGAALFFYLGRSRTLEQEVNRNSVTVTRHTASSTFTGGDSMWAERGNASPQPSRFSELRSFSRQSTEPKIAGYRGSGVSTPVSPLPGRLDEGGSRPMSPMSPMSLGSDGRGSSVYATLGPQPVCVNEVQPQELESPDIRFGR